MTTETRDATLWLAGLLEGEGTFDAHRGKYPRIRLAMTDRDIVARAAALMGTGVRLALHPAPAQPTWHSELSGPRAAAIMAAILPHMGARRSGKIAHVLGVAHFRALPAPGEGERASKSAPGPTVAVAA